MIPSLTWQLHDAPLWYSGKVRASAILEVLVNVRH